jgi:hypothetical protein
VLKLIGDGRVANPLLAKPEGEAELAAVPPPPPQKGGSV